MIDLTLVDLKSVQTDSIDFCRNEMKTFRAKQYDKNSRYIRIFCTDNGRQVILDPETMIPYLKLSAPKNRNIYERENICILDDGSVLIELSESALFYPGHAIGELNIVGDEQMLSTMTFNLIIENSVYDNKEIIASPQYSALVTLIAEEQKRIDTVKNATEAANTATNKANTAADKADKATTNANAATAKANTAADNADQATANANTATSNANTAADNADKARQDLMDALGTFDSRLQESAQLVEDANAYASDAAESATNASDSATAANNSALAAEYSATQSSNYAEEAKTVLETLYSQEEVILANAVRLEYLEAEEALAISFV